MQTPTIAVIEDDAAILDVMTECLTRAGYRTLAHQQGAGAYEFIEHARPDAVVLDVRMEHPRAGLAVLQRLRRDEATARTPVLICTADEQFPAERRRTLADYGCAVLGKPFLIDQFVEA